MLGELPAALSNSRLELADLEEATLDLKKNYILVKSVIIFLKYVIFTCCCRLSPPFFPRTLLWR